MTHIHTCNNDECFALHNVPCVIRYLFAHIYLFQVRPEPNILQYRGIRLVLSHQCEPRNNVPGGLPLPWQTPSFTLVSVPPPRH